MFLQMVNIEQRKLSKRKMFWVELTIIVISVMLVFGSFYAMRSVDFSDVENIQVQGELSEIAELLVWPMGTTMGFEVLSLLGGFLLIIFAGAFVAQEYTWGSFQLWLSRGVPRPIFLLAKFLVAILVTVLFVVTAVFTGVIISAIFSQSNLGTIPFDSVDWLAFVKSILLVSYSFLPYVTLAFFLAVISRSTLVAVGGTLAMPVLIEPILTQVGMLAGGVWRGLVPYLPSNLGLVVNTVVLEIPKSGDIPTIVEAAPDVMSLGTAVFAIAVYIVVFVIGSLFAFQRQDLGG